MAEKRVIELDIQTNEKSLKSQLREAQAEVQKLSEKFGATSQEAVNAAKKASELKDAIEDAKNLTDAFNPDAKFNSLSSSIGGVLNGFQAYEGALGLIGVESESLQKTMLKVQSAMALSQGLQGVLEAKDSFMQLGAVAKDAFKGMTAAGKAFAITGIGLLITGIGILIANWDKVSEYIGITNKEQQKFNEQQKRAIQDAKEMRETVSKESAAFVGYISQLKATNKGSKERSTLISEINKKYGTTLKNLSDEAEFQAQLNKEVKNYLEYQKAKFTLQKNEEKITKNLEVQDEITTKLNKQKRRQIEIEKELVSSQKALSSASRVTTETQLFSQYDKLQEKINSLNAEYKQGKVSIVEYGESLKNAEKRLDSYGKSSLTAQGEIDKLTYNGKKYVEQTTENASTETKTITEVADLKQQIYEEEIKQIQDINAQQQVKLITDAQTRIKEIESSTASSEQKAQLTKLIQENLNKDLEKLDADYYAKEAEAKAEANKIRIEQENQLNSEIEEIDESNFQARLKKSMSEEEYELELVRQKYFTLEEEAKGNAEKLAIIEEAKQAEIDKIEKTYAEKAKVSQQARVDLILKYAQTFGQAMSSLNSLLNANDEERLKSVKKGSKDEEDIKRKMFERDKKLRIVQTIIDTASNVVQSIRNGGGIPTGIPFGIAAAAMGALQIATISKAKFDGGGDQVQSPSAGGGAMAPNFNVIGSSGVNQLAQIQQQPTRAYVVSGDVANGLSLERNRLQNASF
jgi:hypothetical protein